MTEKKTHLRSSCFVGELVHSVSGEHSSLHVHDFGQLILAIRGSLYVGDENRVLLLSPAMVLWIPPGELHWIKASQSNEMLFVDSDLLGSERLGSKCRLVAATPLLRELMYSTLPDESAKRSQEHAQVLNELLQLEFTEGREVQLSVMVPRDRRVLDIVNDALSRSEATKDFDAWMNRASASRKTVERIFVNETGMPPLKWVRQLQVMRAVSRLSEGESVSSIAFDLGYSSTSAFSYMFRTEMGIRPSDIAKGL